MAAKKIISNAVIKAKCDESNNSKIVTVRILEPEYHAIDYSNPEAPREIKSSIFINGQFAPYGALVDLLETEAADLLSRGRAELVID